MQATMDASALKPFTKALTCIARYGEELTIHATSETLALSATNSSKSAYARFKYDKTFFQKFVVDQPDEDEEVTGQLLVKSLLSILRHKTVEKTVEKCEMSIIEGGDDPDHDGLESRLVVVLHCKHGVIKTHRLLLSTPNSLMAPGVPDTSTESFLTVGPRAIKDMVEHFPLAKGNKGDSQLIWHFGERDVEVKTLESSIDSKGKAQLSTELTISAEEFDVYSLYAAPTVIAFHLGEFNATIAFTDAISVTMDLRFTDPAAPLFIDVESDDCQALFVISTSQVQNAGNVAPQVILGNNTNRKRPREDEEDPSQSAARETPRPKKPMKAAQPSSQASVHASYNMTPSRSQPNRRHESSVPPSFPQQPMRDMSMPPPPPMHQPSMPPPSMRQPSMPPPPIRQPSMPPPPLRQPSSSPHSNPNPLFFPAASQQTNPDLDDMTKEELDIFLSNDDLDLDDDELMEDTFPHMQTPSGVNEEGNDIPVDPDDISIEATQTMQLDDSKTFQPLFDD